MGVEAPSPTLLDRLAPLLAAGFHGAIRLLPRQRAVALARPLGRAIGRLGGPRSEVARVNLRIAFPDWSEAQRRRVRIDSYGQLAQGLVETAFLRELTRETLDEWFRFEGLENLEEARKRTDSGGVIVLTGHFGSWELLAPAVSLRGYPVTLVYRARSNPGLERIIDDWRVDAGVETVPLGLAGRAALTALKQGRFVGMPLDQDVNRREGIFVPFFDRLACTRHGPARIAARTGTPVVPVFLFRIGDSSRHVVRIYQALDLLREGAPGLDRAAITRENVIRMNRFFEERIREAPAHWIWVHRRWKTQPTGDPKPYPSRGSRRVREPRIA